MYLVQQCFGFSDEGAEDAVYDSQARRRFVGLDLNREAIPDAMILLRFRYLLEAHHLTESIFDAINAHLAERGLFLREGRIVDATLISAPSSTKNKERTRDTEMHQTKKGKQRCGELVSVSLNTVLTYMNIRMINYQIVRING